MKIAVVTRTGPSEEGGDLAVAMDLWQEDGPPMALGIPVVVVGPVENVFHHLHATRRCATWAEALEEEFAWREV